MDVTLSGSVRNTLSSIRKIASFTERTQERISTGRKNSFTTNPIAAFTAKSLSNRASDFLNVKRSLGQASSQLRSANDGLNTISSFLDQLKAVSLQHESTSSASRKSELSDQFDVLKAQLDSVAGDSSFGGTNLISSNPDNLNVDLNPDGSASLGITGQATDSTTLGVDVTNPASIDAALSQVRSTAETIGSNASVIQIREEFTDNLVNSLKQGEAKLTETDLNEEAANALSLQTRSQLAAAALNIARQSEQAILQLF